MQNSINCSQQRKNIVNGDYPFSLAISIRENPIKGENTGNLYNELIAINTMEAFNVIGLEGEATAEAE